MLVLPRPPTRYVKRLNDEAVATGMPMMRPMALACPDDPVCATPAAEAQFTLGPDWLIAPVTAANATEWSVYLPSSKGHEWVYWWNQTAVGNAAGWYSVDTSNIADFPLFFRRPNAAAPPV